MLHSQLSRWEGGDGLLLQHLSYWLQAFLAGGRLILINMMSEMKMVEEGWLSAGGEYLSYIG